MQPLQISSSFRCVLPLHYSTPLFQALTFTAGLGERCSVAPRPPPLQFIPPLPHLHADDCPHPPGVCSLCVLFCPLPSKALFLLRVCATLFGQPDDALQRPVSVTCHAVCALIPTLVTSVHAGHELLDCSFVSRFTLPICYNLLMFVHEEQLLNGGLDYRSCEVPSFNGTGFCYSTGFSSVGFHLCSVAFVCITCVSSGGICARP